MRIDYAGIGVELEKQDYFFLTENDGTFNLCINGANRHPIKIYNITRFQLMSICHQFNKLLLADKEKQVEKIVAKHEYELDKLLNGGGK